MFARVFYLVDPSVRVEAKRADGTRAEPDDELLLVEGPARSLLVAERTALNFLQRMCGIATLARRFVDAVPAGNPLRVADTRKTTPGLRSLERYAVRTGAAYNHRNDLGSAVLIKDNHIALAGGIARRSSFACATRRTPAAIEVEVESLDALDQALAAGAEIVMLDNFTDELVAEGVRRAKGRAAGRGVGRRHARADCDARAPRRQRGQRRRADALGPRGGYLARARATTAGMTEGCFDRAEFERLCRQRGLGLGAPLVTAALTASTNDDALAAAKAGAPHGATFVADQQTTGAAGGAGAGLPVRRRLC